MHTHTFKDLGRALKIDYIENISSTHKHLLSYIKEGKIEPPYLIYANNQLSGIGSRENSWIGESGNLYMSFCVNEKSLSGDIPPPSICIYFATIMAELLALKGSKVWLKWPNDFYIDKKKIGGIMTNKTSDIFVISMGMNLCSCPQNFATLDIKITHHELVRLFCDELKKNYSWKQVFSKFRLQFQKNKNQTFHLGDEICCLSEAELCDDGSIIIKGKKVYNLR